MRSGLVRGSGRPDEWRVVLLLCKLLGTKMLPSLHIEVSIVEVKSLLKLTLSLVYYEQTMILLNIPWTARNQIRMPSCQLFLANTVNHFTFSIPAGEFRE